MMRVKDFFLILFGDSDTIILNCKFQEMHLSFYFSQIGLYIYFPVFSEF